MNLFTLIVQLVLILNINFSEGKKAKAEIGAVAKADQSWEQPAYSFRFGPIKLPNPD